jgi:hypothetical protein
MKRWQKGLIWVLIAGVVIVVGLQIGQGIKGNQGKPIFTPTAIGQTPGPTPTSGATSGASLIPALAGPITLPKSMFVSVLYDTPLPVHSTVVEWVKAAVRSENWRWFALKTGQVAIENNLMSSAGQFLDLEYGNFFGAENGNPATIGGSPTYIQGYVVTLNVDDLAALQSRGMSASPTYAIILVETGPVTVTVSGQPPHQVIAASPRELILAGGVVTDPQLGEIWQSDLVLGCTLPANYELRIQTCTK